MIEASLPRANPQPSSRVITADPSFTIILLESDNSLLLVAMALARVKYGDLLLGAAHLRPKRPSICSLPAPYSYPVRSSIGRSRKDE